MLNRKGVLLFVAAICAVLFASPSPAHAEFKHDFLYKFQSRWSDIAVSTAAARVFVINDSYSRLEEYNASGVWQATHGSFGTASTPTTEFNRPQGLAFDSKYILYVVDTGNNRVIRYSTPVGASGTALGAATAWGTPGTGAGEFDNPTSITVSSDDLSIYIADTGNNRIQKCTPTGTCTVWGAIGTGNKQFSAPKGIVFDNSSGDNRIYVSDTGNNRIQWFDESGTYLGQFGSYGQFILPYRIETESTGSYLYVLDTLNRIQRINKTSKATEVTINLTSPGGGMKSPAGSGILYTTSLPTTFQTYSISGASITLSLTKTNEIGRPVDLTVDSSGNFYINNNFLTPSEPVIQRFNSSFIQTAEWKGTGSFGMSTSGPMGLGLNTGNDLYVADTDSNKIQKFTSSGIWKYNITPYPTYGAFNKPKDVATESTGKFYIADTGNSRIMKYGANPDTDINGGFIWSQLLPTVAAGTPTPPVGSTPAPYGITVDQLSNNIFVADAGYHRILRYSANDDGYQKSWGEFGSADDSLVPQLDTPQGMAIGPEPTGYIYVADTGNNRIQRFDQDGILANRTVWGKAGAQDGYFDQPRNIAIDSASRVYVSEVGNRRIQAFGDATGSAGLSITQTSGTNITEGIDTSSTVIDNYTVKLNTQPSTNVYITITVSDSTQASVTTPVLVFTQYNWNIPQTVTVVPIHDFISNGAHDVIISHTSSSPATPATDTSPIIPGDIHYQNLIDATVTAHIADSIDVPGVSFLASSTILDPLIDNTVPWATEGSRLSNAYYVVLNTKPTADVTLTLSSGITNPITFDTTTLTFTPANFNTPKPVHITPVHDFIAQGTHVEQVFHTNTSSDPNYAAADLQFSNDSGAVIVNVTDNDLVGVVLSKSSVSVNENGTTDNYTIKLNSKPTGNVTIYPTDSSPSALVTLSPSTVTFSDVTWNTPQTVVVTAIHDYLQNPIPVRTTDIIHPDTASTDPNYANIAVATVSASITDSDTGGLLIFRPGGGSVTATEGGDGDTYAFQLTSIPTNDVVATLTSTDGQATTSAYIYTFTPGNWNTPQYATVSAIDDSIEEGVHYGVLLHTIASADSNFNGKTAYQTATITDNDAAGIVITLPNSTINIAEAGPSDSYFVRLNSQPTTTVNLIFGAVNQATASPANLVFTTSNWNINQEVVISAIQDYIIEGPQTATISYTGVSSDINYNGETGSFVANIADDDSMSPGVAIVETNGGTSVTKGAVTDTYTLVLTSKPTANVKIKIVSNGPDATTSAGVYWFIPSLWNVPQTVNVSAKTDPSSSKTNIFTHYLTSLDAHYDNYSPAPTVNVTVTGGGSSYTLTAANGNNIKAPTCNMTPPDETPNLFQINTTQTEATLYFTPLKNNISYYFIAYGFTPGDFRFGTSFEMGASDAVISRTISMLTPGTKYYFQVRGGNGCATGNWSGSVPAISVGLTSTVTTNTFYAPLVPISTSGSSSSSGGSTSSPTGGIWLTRDLYPGSQGADVRSLQEHLNAHGFTLASSGPGSPGNETTYYGNLTAAAVRRFQEAHFAEILSPLGYASGTGICGSSTRNYINSHP